MLIQVPAAASKWLPRTRVARPMPSRVCRPKKGKQPQKMPAASPRARWPWQPSWAQSQVINARARSPSRLRAAPREGRGG